MRCRFTLSLVSSLLFVGASAAVHAQYLAVAGISRALAQDRAARVSDVSYDLSFQLAPKAETMPGTETVHFTLGPTNKAFDLYIDYRDGKLTSATLNGQAIETSLTDGHLRLPAQQLHAGANELKTVFASRIATAGAAITRYEDKDDGSEYIYSLFVPMDADMAFPCFDQPDLKARFTLSVSAPMTWKVIGNTEAHLIEAGGNAGTTLFHETKPISTYLFAFAAGPWQSVHPTPGQPSVYVRKSQLKRAEPEIPQLQEITARGMKWLADYFQQPFPFPKYDIVLIPGFPFGGMEHAGETFLREDGVLFRTAPTAADRFNRNTLTLHELTHQWFGDLVTMRWFNDLWLKEGFAQYMAYRCLDSLEPQSQAWKHFYETIKPPAYEIDESLGTTPIYQDIPNLKDAKSAYGAIVYQKAPSILKQLEFWLGNEQFRNGLRLYLHDHAYNNAEWSDLVSALHTASGKDVRSWADAWVLRRGMPEVSASWICNTHNELVRLTLMQHDVLPDDYRWPISTEVLLGYSEAANQPIKLRVSFDDAQHIVKEAGGKPCPAMVFPNAGDYGYGRFLLDERSEPAARESLLHGALRDNDADPLLRSMLWGALWDNVHTARSAPRSYVELALKNLPNEQDETLARIQGGHAITALERYVSPRSRTELAPRLEQVVTDRMLHAPTAGLRIISFRTLGSAAETPAAADTLKQLLSGKLTVPDVQLRALDRWNLVGRLITINDAEAPALLTAEQKRDPSGDGQKSAWADLAGTPEAATKQTYFAEYTRNPADPAAKSEDWLTQSLRPFNAWNQSELTLPYLKRALDQLPEIKRDRKIFFLGSWLGAFLGGQTSPEAEKIVEDWLAQPGIDKDLRLKVLENSEELHRTVRIRKAFPE